MSARKTPLYDRHIEAGGNVVDYTGWLLPVEYEGLKQEHEAVRERAGIFDVTHMGEVTVQGPEAQKFINYIFSNDVSKAADNSVQYGFFLNDKGGIVDDLLIYRKGENDYYLVTNGANAEKDIEWINKHKDGFDVEVKDIADTIGLVALQGPKSEQILQKLTDTNLKDLKPFRFDDQVMVDGKPTMVSRTGYTGEDGFEIYSAWDDLVAIWDALMEAGKEEGIQPAGLGCRDTLRFEATMPLYGNELGEDVSPLEAGLGFAVALDKEDDFIGKEALLKQKEEGLKRKVVGFELLGRGIPRQGYDVVKDDKVIGQVTTGYMAPTVGKAIGNALIEIDEAKLGNEVEIQVRRRRIPAKIISRKFLENK